MGQAGPPTPAPPRTVAGAASPGRTGARGGGGRWLEQCPAGQAPLFEGLGDSDVGLATVPMGDCDLADGIVLPVPVSSASFPPKPLGTAGQHPDTPFLGGFCPTDLGVAPSPRAGDPQNGLISQHSSWQLGKGWIHMVPLKLLLKGGEQIPRASVSLPYPNPSFSGSCPTSSLSSPNRGWMLAMAMEPKAPSFGKGI